MSDFRGKIEPRGFAGSSSGVFEGRVEPRGFGVTFDRAQPSGSRSPLGVANDSVVSLVNSGLGIGKAISDFVSVDNPVSRGLQWLIDEGEATYTPQTRASREDLARAIDAGGWEAARGVGEFIVTSPLQATTMAAGNFGPFGIGIKGARGLAALGGVGAAGQRTAGIAAASGMGGAAAGGDAAGDAYEQVMRSPNVDPAVREQLARQAAREASVVPAIIGAATPFLPGSAESQLARGLGLTRASVGRAAASEFGQEFIEEGATKLSANLAARQYDPTIDPSRGVFGSALLGGVLGAGTGAGVTVLNNRAVAADLLRRDEAIQAAERARQERLAPILGLIRPDSGVATQDLINQRLGITAPLSDKEEAARLKAREADIVAAFDAPAGSKDQPVRVAGEDGRERELTAYEQLLLQQGLTPEQVTAPTTPTAPASKVFSPEEQELIDMGVTPNGKALELLSEIKASGLPMDSLASVVTAMAERKNAQAKKLLAQAIIESRKPAAAPAAPAAPVAPVVEPVGSTAASVAEAPGVTSLPVPEVPANVEAPQAVQAEAPAEAAVPAPAAQDAAAPAAATEPVVQRKRRVVTPAALAQSQAFVAPEPVVEQQTTAEASDETDWEDSKPDGAPALAALTPTLQQVWSEARAAKAQGRRINLYKVAEDIVAEQGDTTESEDDTLETLNQIFGERDAAMLFDRYVGDMTEEAIANKYGLSRQAVAKVTGEGALGQKTRATKIANAQKKFGWTDEYVGQLAARLSPAQTTEVDTTSGKTSETAGSDLSAFGGQSAQAADDFSAYSSVEAGSRDPSLREAGFSTSASLGGSVSNWRDSGELAGRENISQADQDKLDTLYARRADAEEKGQDKEVAEADAAISTIEAKYLTPGEVAAKFTQAVMDLQDRVAKRTEQIEQALAAGRTEVSINNKLVPVAELEAEIETLQTRIQEQLEKAEAVLQRGAVRKAKGAEPPKAPKPAKGKVRVVKKAEAAAPAPAAAPAEVLTTTEQAAKAWDQAVNTIPGAPKWAELPAATQNEFKGYGENNWTRQDVVALMQRGMKFGKDTGAVKDAYTAAELTEDIKAFIRADVLGRKLVIVDRVEDLLQSPLKARRDVGAAMVAESLQGGSAYGVAVDGTAYLVANRIAKGEGRAKFMHEVGTHLGLENLLPAKVFDRLAQQVGKWSKLDDGSIESIIAKAALARVKSAGTMKTTIKQEALAYFVEEAMLRGIDPTADTMQGSSGLREWFRTLWAAFKTAVRRLGMKPETLTAQDVVNLAFGAARLELAPTGTRHGTAAEIETWARKNLPEGMANTLSFRRFDNKKMGSGEGAQAYGAGTYLAQREGIGYKYWQADVLRKLTDRIYAKFKGRELTQDVLDVYTGDPITVQLSANPMDVEVLYAGETITERVAKAISMAVKRDGIDTLELDGQDEYVDLSPDGALMRVDASVTQDELLDWDARLRDQSNTVKAALAKLGFDTRSSETGGEFYSTLVERAGQYRFDSRSSGPVKWIPRQDSKIEPVDLQVRDRGFRVFGDTKAAAELLDSLGVKGVRHIDRSSRYKHLQAYKDRKSIDAALKAVSANTRASMALRNSLDLAQEIEGTLDVNDLIRSLGLPYDSDAADAVARYKEWVADKTHNLVIFNDKNIFRVGAQMGADKQRMRFGKNPTERLPAELQKPVGVITNTLRDVGNAALNTLTFTEDVVNRAIGLGVKSAARLRSIYQERAALTGRLEREVERVADLYNRVPEAERGTGPKSVNQFLYDATREGKWGFKPDWRRGPSAKITIDPEMQQRFDALSRESKALVRAIFTHGDEVLSLKKQTVIDATNSEYDALIAAATKAGDKNKAARLTADKAEQLKRFDSLFALQEFRPYAPLRRFGDYVVIARSQKYLDADEKQQRQLEKSEDHYHVSFAESAAAAREMVEQLQKQGAFAEVVFRQKEAVQQTMFGGTLSAFNKLRSELDSELADAAPGEKAALRAARKVVGELYLSTLAENSARKSEMRRRGVAGEIDVLRSFTTQGRADAQFIAGAKYNGQTLDVFNAMRKEVKSGDAEAQNTKSGVFNELVKRHTQSMDYDPTPIASKLARLTSIWYLATSPAYYLQNLTQPFMLSLPVMAGRHNYLKVANSLLKAYTDLAPMFRTAKLGEQFNFAAAPQDVRAAISTLVDRGRIDIGMDTDLGDFQIEGQGRFKDRWNKINRGIRNVAQKLEAVNRLSTAIAAYRMELAKTGDAARALQYADDVITQTHGDYTSGNAPRVFNTPTGKVALQFRKFQLIQLTLLAKLVSNSFPGKQDAAAARKALTFTLGHTAVMAGAIGLPGFAAISWLLGALGFGDDEEPFNAEKELREFIGNDQLATLITRGVPAALGVDLSSKLGMGNVLSLLPFNDMDLSSRSGVESAAFSLFGGPAGGLTLRAVDGLSLIRDGQYYRGLEQLMPTGVTNAMKAYRQATEGVTRRNGDVQISPEEISGMDTFWQAIGFQPTKLAERQFFDRVVRDTDRAFQARADKIRGAYLRAGDDYEAKAEARERWAELQDAREAAGYRRQPLSLLMRAEQSQRERERNTLEGVQFNRENRSFVQELIDAEE